MIKAITLANAMRAEDESSPALKNPAVVHCLDAWRSTRAASLKAGKSEYRSEVDAVKSYLAAMPPLAGYQNICDFIACVGYGMVIEVVEQGASGKLLYAAQVALSAIPNQAKKQGNVIPTPSATFVVKA